MCQLKVLPPVSLGKRTAQSGFAVPDAKRVKLDLLGPPKPILEDVTLDDECECKPKVVVVGELANAARLGQYDLVSALLEDEKKEIDISETVLGCTALHYAAFYGHREIVECLLEYDAPVDCKNFSGKTPLAYAVQNKKIDMVASLLELEADPAIPDNQGFSPLHTAVEMGHYKMVETLLSINTETEEWTKVNAVTKKGYTPLSIAAFKGYQDVVALLLEFDANINLAPPTGLTPLHRAAIARNESMFHFLVEQGADISLCDKLKRTPTDILKGPQRTS